MSDIDDLRERYLAAGHAIQTGVKILMETELRGQHDDTGETSPKHLRVGVNMAMVDHAALVDLLIRKGLLTHAEYLEALVVRAEAERDVYQARVNRTLGVGKVTLR